MEAKKGFLMQLTSLAAYFAVVVGFVTAIGLVSSFLGGPPVKLCCGNILISSALLDGQIFLIATALWLNLLGFGIIIRDRKKK